MLKGQNQTNTRDYNIKAILSYLRHNNMSCSDLAIKVGLSKPALTKITTEMLELGILKVSGEDVIDRKYPLGRKPSYLSVNPDFGMVASVDFSTVNLTIRFSNMQGGLIADHVLEDSEFITYAILDKVIAEIKDMENIYGLKKKPLLSICLATSGIINRDGIIVQSPKFTECVGVNLKEYFQKELNSQIIVKNDINLSLSGEESEIGSDYKYSAMMYIDSGIGGAICIENKVIEGEDGFAGEFGLMLVNNINGESVEFDKLSSINAIKTEIRKRVANGEKSSLNEKFRFKDVKDAFLNGDPLVRAVIGDSTVYVAQIITNLYMAINCRKFLISGRVQLLGDEYLKLINEKVRKDLKIKIMFNPLGKEAIVRGATGVAIKKAIDQVIESR